MMLASVPNSVPQAPIVHEAGPSIQLQQATTTKTTPKLVNNLENAQPVGGAQPVPDTSTSVPATVVSSSLPTGSHEDWMAQAGISASDYGYVDYIISHESGWNPNAMNPSGAEGLPQALPYSKTGCAHGDPVCQLVWANGYAQKYGGWADAYSFWVSNHWW
jgi:hypothetical protein